ncbi:DUF998 domain-containing protein [Fulvivirgaceae bacterium BMA10]|uniref:DUF998 domain-containing protein n=1 Tax=Splendidivirga corallicola TaxID=3051826 RepID=A0ABT8KGG3_9BACT|nr:DUF998 domain-containing protein [Fulvivirgaceae bacterium BMA10]
MNIDKTISKYNWIGVATFIFIIALAQVLTPVDYNWRDHTISQLASQGYDKKWIMQVGFILFGAILNIGIVLKLVTVPVKRGRMAAELLMMVYAGSIFMTGIFCEKPFIDGIEFSNLYAKIHSIFAMIAGIGFSVSILLFGLTAPTLKSRTIHLLFLAMVVGTSVIFGALDSNIGLIQRLLYFISFVWIVFFYNRW